MYLMCRPRSTQACLDHLRPCFDHILTILLLYVQVQIQMDLLLDHLRKLLEEKGHAVVCVAEGAGQDLLFARE